MDCVLHGEFTLQRTTTHAVLDALMNLTLSLTTVNVPGFLTSFFLSGPQRDHLFHHLISRVSFQSLQYVIVVMGFLDAFVYAHHKHRHDSANAGNFGDCLTGRVRFMTAITPAFAHAYQTICFAMHLLGVPHRSFRLPKPKIQISTSSQ